jgi:hypothetical protein
MNIIQMQDQVKGMPTEVLVQNLNNPTGAVPAYLLAGELNRREKMQAEYNSKMPEQTVTEQLVAQAIPPTGIQSLPQVTAPMPENMAPMPENSGIATLPAPNVGQNYAGGGIVAFAEGDLVESESFLERGKRLQKEYGLEDMTEEELNRYLGFAIPSAGGMSTKLPDFVNKTGSKVKDFLLGTKGTPAVPAPPSTGTSLMPYNPNAVMPYKPNALATSSGSPAIPGTPGFIQNHPILSGLGGGLAGYGIKELLNAKESTPDVTPEVTKEEPPAAKENTAQSKRDAAAIRRAYLALALGGAETMAGTSPYALVNAGKGFATGLKSYGEGEQEQSKIDAAAAIAYQKAAVDAADFGLDAKAYLELKIKLKESPDHIAAMKAWLETNGKNYKKGDKEYLKYENYLLDSQLVPYLRKSTTVNGSTYTAV